MDDEISVGEVYIQLALPITRQRGPGILLIKYLIMSGTWILPTNSLVSGWNIETNVYRSTLLIALMYQSNPALIW